MTHKTLVEQYVTLWPVLGDLSADASEADIESLSAIHEAAYELLDQRRLPGQFTPMEDYEQQNYEVCANDAGTEQIDGHTAFGISFYSCSPIPNATVRDLVDATLHCYRAAAAAAGKPDLPVRLLRAVRQNVIQVSDTVVFDPSDPEPPHPTQTSEAEGA